MRDVGGIGDADDYVGVFIKSRLHFKWQCLTGKT